ncbi:MAG: hypothetical protein VX777_05065 [Chlamydiota bacterium]|nr:hypothetical protein [Chlamydiota bacterium]
MSVVESGKRGYWVDALNIIVTGNPNLDYCDFEVFAKNLLAFRSIGFSLSSNILESEEGKSREIKQLYNVYEGLNNTTDLNQRAASLLDTCFMRTIADATNCTLNDETKKYLVETSIPAALKYGQANELSSCSSLMEWIENFYLGSSKNEVANAHAILHRGFSEEETKKFTSMRGNISVSWYNPFKEGKVSIEDVRQLLERLQDFHKGNSAPVSDMNNIYMKEAYEKYVNFEKEYPEDRKELYWNAILLAINKFITTQEAKINA